MTRKLYLVALSLFLPLLNFAQSVPVLVDVIGGRSEVKAFQLPRAVAAPESSSRAGIASIERHTFSLLNNERASKGLEHLRWNEELASIARAHSKSMASESYFSHKGLDGSMVDDRADRSGFRGWQAIGENIAFMRGYEHPGEMAVEKWMQSTSHRNNLLSGRWSESAIGIAQAADGTYYFTQIFILR